jgi:hypothetical protein
VVSLVDVLMTMSLEAQLERNRQSCQTTWAVPAPSISAEGSGLVRRPPATVWRLTLDTSTVARQEAPPSTDRNERTWDWLALFIGTSTVPLGRTSGWPPRAQPMLADPPPGTRPSWKADTIVLPATKVSGSTSVRCWLGALVCEQFRGHYAG